MNNYLLNKINYSPAYLTEAVILITSILTTFCVTRAKNVNWFETTAFEKQRSAVVQSDKVRAKLGAEA